ncbi:hypothetical protein NDN08_000052 [Rhodosorus marinus]|uniref:ATP-dependent RNA helicase n=1 Tax=Rhodosorus marinus TaxID=101924 RepID=A0AAV8UH01_9RHOD|nr:hypothetical protein NDN08_000052 [Rhodosorus marinus]
MLLDEHDASDDVSLMAGLKQKESAVLDRWLESKGADVLFDRQVDASSTRRGKLEATVDEEMLWSEDKDEIVQVRTRPVEKKRKRTSGAPTFIQDGHSGIMRTSDVILTGEDADADFEQLMLPSSLLTSLNRCGFVKPSPVQLRAIPIGRLGVDFIAQAKSGTGKTVVFCVISIESALNRNRASSASRAGPSALILAPTREIVLQISDVARKLCNEMDGGESPPVKVAHFIGGINVGKDVQALQKGVDVAIGTPGRIRGLLRDHILDPSHVKLVVLDEADKLLEGTFSQTVPWIVKMIPDPKQMAIFSATFPQAMTERLMGVLRDPQYISLEEKQPDKGDHVGAVLQGVVQRKVEVNDNLSWVQKAAIAREVVLSFPFRQCICFCNEKSAGKDVASVFGEAGLSASSTNGSESQATRNEVLGRFRDGELKILVATDLLSRGLDLPNCDLVINLDLPRNLESYLHRVGRAGRYGTSGTSVSIARGYDLMRFENAMQLEMEWCSVDLSKVDLSKYDKSKAGLQGSPSGADKEAGLDDALSRRPQVNTTEALTVVDVVAPDRNDDSTSYPEEWVHYWEGFTAAYWLGKKAAEEAIRERGG